MVAIKRQEKSKINYLPQNLKHLRKTKGVTLLFMANELSLKGKTSYLAYEEGRALPDIYKLMKLASYFEVSLDELLNKDLAIIDEKASNDLEKQFEIELVPFSAAAGSEKGYGDLDIRKLKKIKIPFKPYGISRAFEIDGDSMEPDIADGATIIGVKALPNEIKKNKAYVIVQKEDGLQCKYLELSEDNKVAYLISANPKYKMRHIDTKNIKELWEVWKIL